MKQIVLFFCWLVWAGRALYARLTAPASEPEVYEISDPSAQPHLRIDPVGLNALFLEKLESLIQRGETLQGTRPLLTELLETAVLGQLYLKLLDHGKAPAPIEQLELGPLEDGLKSAHCPVCAEDVIGHPVRRCQRCSATHHRDCFSYNGRCGRYGCAN